MFYYRRASPKHCNGTIEVEYGGGGHRTRLRNDLKDQLVCLGVPPAPVYKGARGRPAGQPWRANRGVLLPPGVGLLLGRGEGEREVEERKERGGGRRPPSLVLFGLGREGRAATSALSPLFSLMAH